MNYTMLLHELLLFTLTILIFFGVPLYAFFRRRMVGSQSVQIHNRRRVVKLTVTNILLNSIVYLILILILISLLHKSQFFDPFVLALIPAFLLVSGLTFYGNGIYITSIVLEAYTLPGLKRLNQFKTQFIATHLFHGPISHILIYSGYMIAFLLLTFLDFLTGPGTPNLAPYVLISGLIVGIVYAYGQVVNGTIIYQFLTGLGNLIIFDFVFNTRSIRLTDFTLASYFYSFSISFIMSAIIYFLIKGFEGKSVRDLL